VYNLSCVLCLLDFCTYIINQAGCLLSTAVKSVMTAEFIQVEEIISPGIYIFQKKISFLKKTFPKLILYHCHKYDPLLKKTVPVIFKT